MVQLLVQLLAQLLVQLLVQLLAQLLAQTQSQPVQDGLLLCAEAQQPSSFLGIFLEVSGLLESLVQ